MSSSPPADALVTRVEELITVTVAGSTVVHNPFEDRYVKLSPSAAVLWREIDPQASVGQLAARLTERYGISAERALDDARGLAASLVDRGLAQIR